MGFEVKRFQYLKFKKFTQKYSSSKCNFIHCEILPSFLGMISSRFLLAILLSVGLGIIYGLKVNLHVAIVSMVNHTDLALKANSSGENHSHTGSVVSIPEEKCESDDAGNATTPQEVSNYTEFFHSKV